MTQPTHDEVMAWIEKELLFLDLCNDEQGWESSSATNYRASLLANRAGLERHKEANGFCWSCHGIHDTGELFPCPSYAEIYDLIRSVM